MLSLLITSIFATQSYAQTWCNKNYLPEQPVVHPGGQFRIPELSPASLLVFRCAPIITPYLEDEDHTAGLVIEAFTTNTRYNGAEPIVLGAEATAGENLDVTISIDGSILSQSAVRLNSTSELHFPLANLSQSRKQPFTIDCTASYTSNLSPERQIFGPNAVLFYLPRPSLGSATKRDSRTGALLVRTPGSSSYEAVFPVGFYTSFDGYLDSNLRILDELKAQGFTIVHPVPTFGNLTVLERVLDRMEELGLYLVYDMRHTYKDRAALTAEVDMIKHRSNLLLWYTADEPDGTSDPRDAPRAAYNAIYELDSYHPASLALNCADYEFAGYAWGADIVMSDTYTIGNDPTWSAKYDTRCTEDFGCCGCDNCRGELEDVSRRLDDFAMRLDVLGWSRTKSVWAVPQAFGGEEFWTRPPTGREFAIQVILSVNHGARGIMPWIDPTPSDIKSAAAALAAVLNSQPVKAFIFSPQATFSRAVSDRIDAGMWTLGSEMLLLVANLNAHETELVLPLPNAMNLREVLNYGVRRVTGVQRQLKLELEGLGCAIFILFPQPLAFHTQDNEL
ncbi:hypothetical protein C8R45DRAFT_1175041 [Mycena sanguinolenta]|nr:hypothetical protein C8R45DRAFT_1175041 [Mycena sanguinolenta]